MSLLFNYVLEGPSPCNKARKKCKKIEKKEVKLSIHRLHDCLLSDKKLITKFSKVEDRKMINKNQF